MKRLLLVFLFLGLSVGFAFATDYYVATSGSNSNGGTSFDDAWETISYAVNQVNGTAGNPAIIHVAAGTYDRNHEGDFPIEIPGDVGYLNIMGEGVDETVIDGTGAPDWEEYYMITVNGADNVDISNLHLTGVRGGIYAQSMSFDISCSNLLIDGYQINNSAEEWPAIRVRSHSGNVDLENVVVDGARSEMNYKGGAAFQGDQISGNVVFSNVTFDNIVTPWQDGGAVYLGNIGGDVIVNTASLDSPYSGDDGGGFYINNVDGNVEFNHVSMDTPVSDWGDGGAFYIISVDGDVTFNDITLEAPESNDDGGGIYLYSIQGDVSLTDIVMNTPDAIYNHGGAIYTNNLEGSFTLANGTFTAPNCDDHGSVLYMKGIEEEVAIENITVTDAEATYQDGGVFHFNNLDGALTVNDVTINGSYSGDDGGAFYIYDVEGHVRLENVSVTDSYCEWGYGGSIYGKNINGGLEFINVSVDQSRSWNSGGGIYLYDLRNDLLFDNVEVMNATALLTDDYTDGIPPNPGHQEEPEEAADSLTVGVDCTTSADGGGVFIENVSQADSMIFNDFSVCFSHAWGAGGGLYLNINHGDIGVRFNGLSLLENTCGTWSNGGGANFYKVNDISIKDATIRGNQTSNPPADYQKYHGGGLYFDRPYYVKLDNVVFMDNLARGNGGGLYITANSEPVEIINCYFLDNKAYVNDGEYPHDAEGGGLYLKSRENTTAPDAVIKNTLFAGNFSNNCGGGVYLKENNNSSIFDIVNVTMAYNQSDEENSDALFAPGNAHVNFYNSIIWANGDTTRTAQSAGDQRSVGSCYDMSIEGFGFYYSNIEENGGQLMEGDGMMNENPFYTAPEYDNFTVLAGSPTIDNGMPYDEDNPYSYYTQEEDPNGERVNQGFWGDITGAGINCDHCGGTGGGPGSASGPPAPTAPQSQSFKFILRDKYAFIGSPVVPEEMDNQQIPIGAWGDDMNFTDPSMEEQTWRFSRWTNGTPYGDNELYVGYLRYMEIEEYNQQPGIDVGDPPDIQPGLGYWIVWNYGAWDDREITQIDIHKVMREAQPYVLPLDPWPGPDREPEDFVPYGANQMANPWPFNISWQNIRFSNDQETWYTPDEAADMEWINNYAMLWDHENEYYYQANGTIGPWEGFWILVRTQEDIYIQFNPIDVSETSPTMNRTELDEVLDWSLLLTARRTDALQVDYDTWIGVGQNLEDTYDKYDAVLMAPQAKEAIQLYTRVAPSGDNPQSHRLAYDFRSNDFGEEGYKAWLTYGYFLHDPSAPGAGPAYPVDVKIQWPNITSVPEDVTLRIYEYNGGTFVPNPDDILVADMRETPEFIANLNTAYGDDVYYTRFWIVATTDAFALDAPGENHSELPTATEITNISPNPFNNSTKISFALKSDTQASLKIFNLLGQEVTTVANKHYNAGYHTVPFNADNLASGVYFLRFESKADGISKLQKIVLQK